MIELDIVERLRGKVRVPVNDGAGLLDGKDFFERVFPTSKAAMEAADEIVRLRAQLEATRKALERCQTVLGNMAEENEGAIFNRWPVNHEPLRADAKNLLPIIEAALEGTQS